jgi:hypothetical protein
MEVFIMTDNHSYAESCGVIEDIQPAEVRIALKLSIAV